jgi:hypothetical protein
VAGYKFRSFFARLLSTLEINLSNLGREGQRRGEGGRRKRREEEGKEGKGKVGKGREGRGK